MPFVIALIVFVIVKVLVGGWIAPVTAAFLATVAAFGFFARSATTGLAQANLSTYVGGRRDMGLSHIDALRHTVETRYAILPAAARSVRIDHVWSELQQRHLGEDERGDLEVMVLAMFASENPQARTIPAFSRLRAEFDRAASRYGLPDHE